MLILLDALLEEGVGPASESVQYLYSTWVEVSDGGVGSRDHHLNAWPSSVTHTSRDPPVALASSSSRIRYTCMWLLHAHNACVSDVGQVAGSHLRQKKTKKKLIRGSFPAVLDLS